MRRPSAPPTMFLALALAVFSITVRPGADPLAAASAEPTAPDPSTTSDVWPGFRGPGGSARLPELEHPSEWGAEQNVAWKVDVPGGGWSSPVVAGGRVFVTTATHPDYDGPVGFRGGVQRMRDTGGKPEGPMTF